MDVVKGLKKIGPITSLTVYRIRSPFGLYFRWCYIEEARAQMVAAKLEANEQEFHRVNWTPDPEQAALSDVERAKMRFVV